MTVTLSPKYQVVIPREIREAMDLVPGQKLEVIRYGERIEFVPVKDLASMKGCLGKIDISFERKLDRI